MIKSLFTLFKAYVVRAYTPDLTRNKDNAMSFRLKNQKEQVSR